MKKRIIGLTCSMLLVTGLLVGCGGNSSSDTTSDSSTASSSTESSSSATNTAERGELTIGFSWSVCNDSLYYAMQDTLEQAVEEEALSRGYSGVKWIHVVSGEDTQKQADDIEDLITQEVDAIFCYPYDMDAIKTSIASARAENIPFITYDRNVSDGGEQPDAWIGLDSTQQAYDTGVALFQRMKDEGIEPKNIIELIGDLGDINATNRIAGYEKAAKEFGLEITVQVPTEWSADTALTNLTSTWQTYSDSNCILSASDIMSATAVQSVLESAGKWLPNTDADHVWYGSCDVFPAAIEQIQGGFLDYDAAYDVGAMAETAAPVVLDFIEGKGLNEDAEYACQATVVDQDNIDKFDTLWSLNY